MDGLRKKLKFLRDVKANKVDYGELPSVMCIKMLRILRLWYTEKDFKSASILDKFIYYLMPTAAAVLNASALHYRLLNDDKMSPKSIQKLGFIVLMIGCWLLRIHSEVFRKDYSSVVEYANQLSRSIRRRKDGLECRPFQNRIYLGTLALMFLIGISAILFPLPLVIELLSTGELYFKTSLPFDVTPYSWSVYVQCAIHLVIIYWDGILCLFFLVVMLEPFLRFAISFKLIAQDISRLREDGTEFTEDEEYQKLRSLVMQYSRIKHFLGKANRASSPFFVAFSLSFLLIGLFLILSLKTGSSFSVFIYCYHTLSLYAFAVICCVLGQFLADSGEEVEVAIYNCPWYSAPSDFTDMILMFLMRSQQPTLMHGEPFYELKLTLIARMTNHIYNVVTIARQFF